MTTEPTVPGSPAELGENRMSHGPPFAADGAALRMAAHWETDAGTKEELLREAAEADSLEGAPASSRATRPPWLTPDMLGYIAGLVDGASVYNAGHLPLDFLYAMLAWRFSLPAEDAREAVRVWREIRQPPEADEGGA